MADLARRYVTYDDLLAVPEHLVAEILNGRLVTHPRPAPKHAVAASALGGGLFAPFHSGCGGPGGWWILDEPELHLGPHVLVPDLAGWRRERLPAMPETAWFELPPDWVCEILSPSTAREDRAEKLPIYAEHGVPHLWLIDPELRTVEVFELRERRWLLLNVYEDSAEVSASPFTEIKLPLSSLWA